MGNVIPFPGGAKEVCKECLRLTAEHFNKTQEYVWQTCGPCKRDTAERSKP